MTIRSRRPLQVGGSRGSYYATCRRCWRLWRAATLPDAFAAALNHLNDYLNRTEED